MSKALTPLELKVMNLLWLLKKAFVKDILNNWNEEKTPAYNTVSTTVRILEDKGYVQHKAIGKSHEYFPVISKTNYQKKFMRNVLNDLFAGSYNNLVSTLLDKEKLSANQITELENLINKAK